MTSEGHDPPASATDAKAAKRTKIALPGQTDGRPPAGDLRLCPFLVTENGNWRAAFPVRDHLCAAVMPLVPLALEKQRRLCLTEAHRTCPAFLAGSELRDGSIGPAGARVDRGPDVTPEAVRGPRRPVPSTTPVLLERTRSAVPSGLSLPGTSRASGQAILIVLLVIAFAVIVLARFQSSGGGAQVTPSPSTPASQLVSASAVVTPPSPSPVVTPSPNVSPSPSSSAPLPSPSPTASPTVRPTKPPATPSPTPPVGTRTYTVKFGDSLSSIAHRFGVTVASIQALNGIQDPSLIHPGQVLQIP